jgi:Na+-driven multidrug efflux pump
MGLCPEPLPAFGDLFLRSPYVVLFGLGNVLSLVRPPSGIYCVGAVFAGLSIIMAAYFPGAGESMLSFVIVLLRNLIVLLPPLSVRYLGM